MKAVIQDIRKTLQPPRWDSWQTLLLMSMLSVLLASLATGVTQTIISSGGWIWLILSIWWLVYDYKKQITFGFWFTGPWIVAAAIALFLSSNFPIIPKSALLILWAPIAAGIAILPNFIKSNAVTKEPEWAIPPVAKRQGVLLLVLTHFLVACWIQFYFLLQTWLTSYPSLRAEDLNRGHFVMNVQPAPQTRAVKVLQLAESALKEELKDKDWPAVEQWLLETNDSTDKSRQRVMSRSITALENRVQAKLQQQALRLPEDDWWKLGGKVTGGEYDLQLQAYLQRPNTDQGGHTMTMSCQINPQTIALKPEKVALRKEDVDIKTIGKNLPRFKTIAKIKCDQPTQPSDREAQIQEDGV
jgi:hypothetical protein